MKANNIEKLIQLLKTNNLTIGSCESLTAGLFCSTIAQVSGASSVLVGGIICYATRIKEDVLKVSSQTIETYGVISKECALEMAQSAQAILGCDICVSFTGNSGPTAMENKPVGYVCCCILIHNDSYLYTLQLSKDRNQIREDVVLFIIKELMKKLENK